jgi:hypothetical protein
MDTSEPSPKHSSNSPRVLSSTPTRSFATGTSGAHAAIADPTTRKAARVDHCCRTREGSRSFALMPGADMFDALAEMMTFLERKQVSPGSGSTLPLPDQRAAIEQGQHVRFRHELYGEIGMNVQVYKNRRKFLNVDGRAS